MAANLFISTLKVLVHAFNIKHRVYAGVFNPCIDITGDPVSKANLIICPRIYHTWHSKIIYKCLLIKLGKMYN